MKRIAILSAALALAGCGTVPLRGIVKEKVEVAQACPDERPPAPVYPDTPDAVKNAPDILALTKLLLDGRILRDERLAEDNRQIGACTH